MDTAGLDIACGQFRGRCLAPSPCRKYKQPVTLSPGRGFVKDRRMRVFIEACFAIPALSALGSNGYDSTYFSSPIVIQTYCPRIKDRFGKNLPEPLIWMLFGGIIFFQLRAQDIERFYFWPEIPVYERSYF